MFSFNDYIKSKQDIFQQIEKELSKNFLRLLHVSVSGDIVYKVNQKNDNHKVYQKLNILVVVEKVSDGENKSLQFECKNISLNIKSISKENFLICRNEQDLTILEHLALPDIYVLKKDSSLYENYSFNAEKLIEKTRYLIDYGMNNAKDLMSKAYKEKNIFLAKKSKYLTWHCLKYVMIMDYLVKVSYKQKVTLKTIDLEVLSFVNSLYFVLIDDNIFKWNQWVDICKTILHQEVSQELFCIK